MARSPFYVVGVLALLALGSSAIKLDERPVAKVIRLLKEMNSNLEKEAEEDEATYDKMACWCETNEKAKTKAIVDGQASDEQLTALIPELAAKSAQLKVAIEHLKKETGKNEKGLAEATELRAKELGAFRTEEKDAIATITGLRNALGALSLKQEPREEVMLQMQQVLTRRNQDTLHRVLSASQRRAVDAMLHKKSSAPGGGEIFGVLGGMKESFEQNLANAKKEEEESKASYLDTKAAKEEEISAAIKQLENKQVELGNTDEKRAGAKEELEDTRKAVTADQAFLADLQERCGSMDKEFADRQKMRADEMAGVSEALKILTDDDAHDLFAKTTLFQVKTVSASSAKRDLALKILREAGKRLGNSRLSMLALTMRGDIFAKIKEVVDDLVEKLKAEQADDVQQRDVCYEEINTNEKATLEKIPVRDDAATRIEEIGLAVDKLGEEVAAAQDEITETQKETKVASENREKENHEFQLVVTDQRATQKIITKALDRLKAFYEKDAFLQLRSTKTAGHSTHGQAPPPGFSGEYKKSEGASGVLGMMQQVIDESKQVEEEAVKAEAEAQAAYEQFAKDSKESVDALNKSIADNQARGGKLDAEKIRTTEDLKSLNADLDGLKAFKIQVHSECDFLLKNFEVRQSSRTQEIEALAQAKAVMSGAQL